MPALPAFIAFTGLDTPDLIPGLIRLSQRYPIEWGILIDDTRKDDPLFPDAAARQRFLETPGLRFAAHVCGQAAHEIANAPDAACIDLSGFQRVQVNHSFAGSTAAQIEHTVRFGRRNGIRMLLQCSETFPEDSRLDWLFDTSFGTGQAPARWPALPNGPFCGFSGGIGPHNAAEVVRAINAPKGRLYWIDMESRIRTDGWLDLIKCERVCREVYG
ncbi:phosphoribosylanthranilate isomerase [Asticcacaulis sp. AND118]|uniref:phosphoribosylanthranilate isomerase n=1 Tax=Asticcacaulis sp. AND118 TaxID=2840468 RepID=UPI001CFF8018|nr:phosphoribosylanthranilate isomerase [Asticcacaulis sp. AND118]UDF03030.1 phosphoribosylanthranilate isomerase [Asticcacaulis sp. AND118]